jgi:glyoxylase-like metal-dependent hydrolase (beta-lactamase superfamily II)
VSEVAGEREHLAGPAGAQVDFVDAQRVDAAFSRAPTLHEDAAFGGDERAAAQHQPVAQHPGRLVRLEQEKACGKRQVLARLGDGGGDDLARPGNHGAEHRLERHVDHPRDGSRQWCLADRLEPQLGDLGLGHGRQQRDLGCGGQQEQTEWGQHRDPTYRKRRPGCATGRFRCPPPVTPAGVGGWRPELIWVGSKERRMSKKRKALYVLLIIVVALVPVYFWLFTESTVPSSGQFTIDLAEVRKLADALPGEKPVELRFEELGSMIVPSTGIVAGTGFSDAALTFYAYQLLYQDQSIVIDTGMDRKTADETQAKNYDDGAFGRVTKALAIANPIVVTHEHYDHLGGLVTQPNLAALMPRVKVTVEQLSNPKKLDPVVFPKEALNGYVPLAYDRMTAIAPGVVLIKAAGHTPGTQLVYVKRSDGAEYLFLGDVAWHWRNVQEVRTRARLVTLLMGEDRGLVLLQLQEIHRLATAEPKLNVVPGHDKSRIDLLVSSGLISQRFETEPPPVVVPAGP